MKWEQYNLEWNSDISNKLEKEKLAEKIAQKVQNHDVIGFGSGSTSYLAAKAIAKRIHDEGIDITAIPTSCEIDILCGSLGIKTSSIDKEKPDWSFDGTDEYDSNGWLIKGRGAAMFKEKLNIINSKKVYILADSTKHVKRLGMNFSVPIECFPSAYRYVSQELIKLGTEEWNLRVGKGKDGPIITENGNFIIDAKFSNVYENLEKEIKLIPGVIESGLFIGYENIEILN
ncbi:MAG: ribose 5-phosphate isomerase A [Clostridia bacterium]|nr:ribose 5-phosphate isomerase A [Clostridia bacterium]